MHVCTDAVDVGEIDRCLAMFQTSSPSYVLMTSIDGCIKYLSGAGADELDVWCDRVEKFRKSMEKCKRIRLFDDGGDGRVYAYDRTKLVLLTIESALGGIALMKALRNKYRIELEMASANYALAMTGAGDTLGSYLALSEALYDINNSVRDRNGLVRIDGMKLPEKVFEPCQVRALKTEYVELDAAIGRIAAETVVAFPPCCPLIVKGEKISNSFIRYALYLYECGVDVYSEHKSFPNKILVTIEDKADKSDEPAPEAKAE